MMREDEFFEMVARFRGPAALVRIGEPLPGPLAVYGPVREDNVGAGVWLVRAYACEQLRGAWARLPSGARRRVLEKLAEEKAA